MNENKRILLVAFGILVLVASDPLVSATFETPRSVCTIARNLAVSAFDSLVRSTLPLSSDRPEVERTEEVLVAGPQGGEGPDGASLGGSDRDEKLVLKALRTESCHPERSEGSRSFQSVNRRDPSLRSG